MKKSCLVDLLNEKKGSTFAHFCYFSNPIDPLNQLCNGPMDQWTNGPLEQSTNDPMVQWTHGPYFNAMLYSNLQIGWDWMGYIMSIGIGLFSF